VQRDCSRRGYTSDQVLEELDRRELDSEAFIRPQQRWADIVVSFMPGDRGGQDHLDAKLTLRDGLGHPDLVPAIDGEARGLELVEAERERFLWISGDLDPAVAAEVEESIWDRMHFASHLRSDRLGEYTIGTQLHRSESLAIVQLLVLYHLVTARATVALGGVGPRVDVARLSA
jgi:phosphoribulokinase